MGGVAFSLTTVWSQIFPFIALQMYEDENNIKDTVTMFLIGSFSLWVLLNIVFFCTIDLAYLHTFFGTMTASQYTCNIFSTSEEDGAKFDAVFTNRIEYTKKIHKEVRVWVGENIERWKEEEEK